MKRIFAIILLAIFAWGLAPAELLHECHEHQSESSSLVLNEDHSNCAICYYQFSSFESGQSLAVEAVFKTIIPTFDQPQAIAAKGVLILTESRGPPTV